MIFKVTEKVLRLVDKLYEEGYSGECIYSTPGYSGALELLQNTRSLNLSGFCKETLHLVENISTNEIVAVGRYSTEDYDVESVKDIATIAWDMYLMYENSGYSMPSEFIELFKKYGYIEEVQTTTYVKKDLT